MANIEVTRTELVWPGKYDGNGKRREVERVSLPFQVIERVNESRATREARTERGLTLFDVWKGDEGQTFEDGWRNKLIWGENLLVLNSLLKELAGKVALIYIDPPFATGSDFSSSIDVGEDDLADLERERSMIEEKVFRDTWSGGTDSYLATMSDRLHVMRELLAPTGTFFLHCDWHFSHYLKLACDEVFGRERFVNEIQWCYSIGGKSRDRFGRKHDTILFYSNSERYAFNGRDPNVVVPRKPGSHMRVKIDDDGREYQEKTDKKSGKVYRYYVDEGKTPNDYWTDIEQLNWEDKERVGYATQKPVRLLKRVIAAVTEPGDLVGDFFCGSGTTMVAAEQLGRRWIGCDLGRFAVHLTRKRLLDLNDVKPFEMLNLGMYERRYWQVATFGEDLDADGEISLYEYVAFILKLYGAAPTTGLQHLHGKLGTAFVHVGAVDTPVTIGEVAACVEECSALKATELHVLGWEWEMGLNDLVSEEARRSGVKVVLRQIPREVMEEQAAAKGDVRFFELAYLEASVEPRGNTREIEVELENFVIPNPELVPDEVREKISRWSDYVDYWAVDWDFRDDTFMQGWVTYRTRKNRTLALRSNPHTYAEPGEYAVMVKVIDVFGNDTSKILRISVS